MSKLLINEPPLQVLPTLACYVGLNEAMFLQQVHYWLDNPKIGRSVDGRKWVRNTMEEWLKQFPFWSESSIRRVIKNLRSDGLLLHRTDLNQKGYDQTGWFSLDYDLLNQLRGPVKRVAKKNNKRTKAVMTRYDDSTPLQDVTHLQDESHPPSKRNPQNKGVEGLQDVGINTRDTETTTESIRERDDALDIVWTLLLSTCDNDEETAVNIWQLQEAFCEHSKLPRPDIDTEHGRTELADHWWPTLKQVLKACDNDPDKAIKALIDGVAAQSEWRADSVSSPKTVQKKTMALIAAWKRGADPANQNGNGQDNGRKPKRRPVSSSTQAAANYAMLRQRMLGNEQ